MKQVYLAGFDVFYPDAAARGEAMKALCAAHGLQGLYPLDNQATSADEIYRGNLALIRQADAICANVNPFRGDEPDSGTCFEIGYAAALGKEIYLYRTDGRTQRERLGDTDQQGFSVEDFGMAVNLMLGCAGRVVYGSLEDCLRLLEKP